MHAKCIFVCNALEDIHIDLYSKNFYSTNKFTQLQKCRKIVSLFTMGYLIVNTFHDP